MLIRMVMGSLPRQEDTNPKGCFARTLVMRQCQNDCIRAGFREQLITHRLSQGFRGAVWGVSTLVVIQSPCRS